MLNHHIINQSYYVGSENPTEVIYTIRSRTRCVLIPRIAENIIENYFSFTYFRGTLLFANEVVYIETYIHFYKM
jgi:hypothetical protein